jgi:predicted PurR-regulated permease PerM
MEQVRGILSRLRGAPGPVKEPAAIPPIGEPPPIVVAPVVAPPPPTNRGPFVGLLIAAVVLLWLARDVLGPFVIAAVAAYAFSPLVVAGQRRTGWSRVAVVGVGYAVAVAIIALLVYLLAGRVAHEINMLAASGPESLATLLRSFVGSDTIDIGGQHIAVADIAREIQARISGLISSPGDAAHLASQAGQIGLEAILALIVTFYFLVDGPMLRDRAIQLLPAEHVSRTTILMDRIHDVLGKWLRGQVFLVVLVSAVVYVALGPILHLPYALGIAILTGILEIIPLIGPLIATAIAATDAFARGGGQVAAVVVVVYFVIRQVEDQIVMPVVIGRAVHLHPVVTIFAVLVGLSVYGVLGGLLGVPVAAAINVVFRELYPPPATESSADL